MARRGQPTTRVGISKLNDGWRLDIHTPDGNGGAELPVDDWWTPARVERLAKALARI